MNLKTCFLVVGVLIFVGCSRDGGSSGGAPAPSGTASQAGTAVATGPLTDGTQTRMSNGSTVDTCSAQVLADYDVVLVASDTSGVDFMSEQAMSDYRAKSEAAQNIFQSKYPNIKCGYNDGRKEVSICSNTNSTIQCGSRN